MNKKVEFPFLIDDVIDAIPKKQKEGEYKEVVRNYRTAIEDGAYEIAEELALDNGYKIDEFDWEYTIRVVIKVTPKT